MNKTRNVVSRYQKYFVFIVVLFFAQIIFFSQNSFVFGVPAGPMALSGTVFINDIPAPKGTIIESWIGGEFKGSVTTSVIGQYGSTGSNKLIVTCIGDNMITFKAKLPGEDTYATSEQILECVSWEVQSDYHLDFTWDGVIEVNNPPVSNDVVVTLDEDTDKIINLDSFDNDGNSLSYELVDSPSHGSFSGDMPDIVYLPELNYFGDDSFTYRANDGIENSNIATVFITINPVNDIPISYNDGVFTSENTLKTIILSAFDVEGDDLSYLIVSDTTNGDISILNNVVTYIPDTDYNGDDFFTFKVNDGVVDSNVATISITVSSVNTPPVVDIPTSVSFFEDSSISYAFDLDDFVLDDGPISAISWSYSGNNNIDVLIDVNNDVSFTSNILNWYGNETITFIADDGQYTDSDDVLVIVESVNDAPIVSNMPDVSLLTGESRTTLWTLDMYVSDSETPDDELIWAHTGDNPISIIINLNRTLSISAPTDWYGNETIIFSASDGNLSDSGSVFLSVIFVDDEVNESVSSVIITFFGNIFLNDVFAHAGTVIEAWVGEEKRGYTTTSVDGVYGNMESNKLLVTCNSSEVIRFKAKFPGNSTYVLSNQTLICNSTQILDYDLYFFRNVDDSDDEVGIPILPAFFYGSIILDGAPAAVGTQITAYVGGDERDTFTTTTSGVYGQPASKRFIINGGSSDQGKIVEFYVNGLRADQTSIWGSGDIIELNLDFITEDFYEPTAPRILSIEPSGVVFENRFNITVKTNLNASCRFDYSSKDYEFMNYDFETTGGLNHIYEVYRPNGNYTVYVYCMRDGLVSNHINTTEFVVSAPVADYAPMIIDANISVNNESVLNGSRIYALINGVERDSAEVFNGTVNLTLYGDASDIGMDIVFYLKIPGLENMSVSLQNLSWINGSYVFENLTFEAHDMTLRDISNPSTVVLGYNVVTFVVLENTQNTNETVNVSFYVDGNFLRSTTYDVSPYESKTLSSDWTASGVGTHKLLFNVSFESDQNESNNFVESQISVINEDTGSSGGSSSGYFTSFVENNETNVSNYTVENIDTDDDDGAGNEENDDDDFKMLDDVMDDFNPLNLFENTTEIKKDTSTPTGFSFANPGTFAITTFVLTIVVLLGVRFLIMARI